MALKNNVFCKSCQRDIVDNLGPDNRKNRLCFIRVSILEKPVSVRDEFRQLSAQNNVCSFGYPANVTAYEDGHRRGLSIIAQLNTNLLSVQTFWHNFCENGVIKTMFSSYK